MLIFKDLSVIISYNQFVFEDVFLEGSELLHRQIFVILVPEKWKK